MGSCHSKAASLPADEVEECNSFPTEISCFMGIRKIFSRNEKVSEDDIDSDDDDDNYVELVPISSKAPAAVMHTTNAFEIDERDDFDYDDVELLETSSEVPADVTAFVSTELRESKSAPPLIGQWRSEQTPALISKVEEDLPSTSYSRDIRVSAQDFLSYHRFINDDESDDESVSSDIESHTVDDVDADVESNVDDDVTGLVFSEDEYTDNDCSVDQEDDEVIEKNDLLQIMVKVIHQTELDADSSIFSADDDVTTDDEATSHGDDVDKIEIMLVISLIWAFIRNAFSGVVQFVQDIMEDGDDESDEMDVDDEGVVVVNGETQYRTPLDHVAFMIWAFLRNVIYGVIKFFQGGIMEDGMDVNHGGAKSDIESDVETDSETDIDQPSTSYKGEVITAYDFKELKKKYRLQDASSPVPSIRPDMTS